MIRRPIALRAPLLLAVGALCLLVAVPFAAAKDDYIEISGASFKPLPLAVARPSGPEDAAKALGAALEEDLLVAGIFQLLDPASFLAAPGEGMTKATIDFSKWSAVGADFLVKTSVSRSGEAVRAELRLFDVLQSKEVLRASETGADERKVAHAIADRLFEHFTGEKGIFSTRIAWARPNGEGKEIWVSDFDGRNAFALTSGGVLNKLPAMSPDGRSVVFTSYRTGFPMLHVGDLVTRAVRPLPARGDFQAGGAFSPDGSRIAFTMSVDGAANIFLMNADGSELKALTRTRYSESSPTWSPDGKRLAFMSTRSGGPQIFLMDADGENVERLTFQGNNNTTPDWSPQGDVIAFTARDERQSFDIFTVDVRSKKIRRLTQDAGDNMEPSFSPNGRHIVFSSTRDGRQRLWVMNADGTNPRPLHAPAGASTPSWGPWTR